MNTGKMRYKIKIIRDTDKTEFHSCNCSIKELFGKEKIMAMGTKAENTIKFEIRYLDKLKELRKYRLFKVIYDNSEYKIIDVDFNNFKKDKIFIQVSEIY